MATTAERLELIRTAIAAQEAAGGAVRVKEADGREVQYDLAWLVQEEARLARQLRSETSDLAGTGMFRRIRFRRMRG